MTTTDIGTQHRSADDAAGGEAEQASTDVDETLATEDGQDADQDNGKPNREAAKYRRRLRQTEAELASVRTQLDTMRRSVIQDAARAAGIDPRLLAAAGHDTAALLDDNGAVDAEKLRAAIAQARTEFLPPPGRIGSGRKPKPNDQQGTGGKGGRASSSWSKALKG